MSWVLGCSHHWKVSQVEGEYVLGFTWNFLCSNGEARKDPTLQGMSPYPTNRESRNLIDSKGPAGQGVVCDPSHASVTPLYIAMGNWG